MESSKATTKHIRQVAGDLPAAQIHLMHHQHTEPPTRNYNKQKNATKQKLQNHRPTEQQTSKKPFDLRNMNKQSDRCIRCGNTIHAKGFQCPAKIFQCKVCHKCGHFTTVCYRRINRHQAHLNLGNLRHTNYKQGPYTLIKMVIAMYLKNQILRIHSVYR